MSPGRWARLGEAMVSLSAAVLMTAADTARAQEPRPDRTTHTAAEAGKRDIVVEGRRDKARPSPKTVVTGSGRTAGPNNDNSPIELQYKYAYAEDVARCALNDGPKRLSAVVDGMPNYASQVFAQDWITRNNITCSVGANLLTLERPKLGYSIYQRGALIAQVIRAYAPDLKLTRAQTLDPAVIKRFEAREGPRNRYRLPIDQTYFRAAVCMVQLDPEDAVRIVTEDLTRTQRAELQASVIDGGRMCVGNPRRVYVESTQFRVYITDAVYRWAVAASGRASLLPLDR